MGQKVLAGLVEVICKVWVDDTVIVRGHTREELLLIFLAVLKRLVDRGFFAAARKCNVYIRPVTWCWKVYSGKGNAHLEEGIEGLVNMRRLDTGRELI